jgi:hypothetical protein
MNLSFAHALSRYAVKFHAAVKSSGTGNVAASPLGSWMLLASLAASTDFSSTPDQRTAVEEALGMPVEDVAYHVEALRNKEELNYVSNVWYRPEGLEDFPGVQKWVSRNTVEPAEAVIPSQDFLDRWASDNTNGLITKFPVTVDPNLTMFLMANVIYSKLVWKTPFDLSLHASMTEAWKVDKVLSSTSLASQFYDVDGNQFISTTVNADNDSEQVHLVLPLNKELDDSVVVDAAYRIVSDPYNVKLLVVDDVTDSGETLFRRTVMGSHGYTQSTVVPAWNAESTHDLLASPVYGYKPLSEALAVEAKDEWEAKAAQSVVASVRPQGERVVLNVNYNRKFVFVSTVDSIPVFSGIIDTAKQPEE